MNEVIFYITSLSDTEIPKDHIEKVLNVNAAE